MPLLSIITVCKNPGFSIIETVESVLSQSFKNYEYIIIDASSSDGTGEYLKRLYKKNKIDNLVIEKDHGIYHAINKGIRISRGTYIGLIHAGDTYCENIFKLINPYLDSKKDIIYGSGYLTEGNLKTFIELPVNSHFELSKKNSIIHTSSFVKKNLYQEIGMYNTKFVIAGDFDFFKKALDKNYKFEQLMFPISNNKFGGISTKFRYISISAVECAKVIFGDNFTIKKIKYIINYIILSFFYILKKKLSHKIYLLKKLFFNIY
jgi:glycosyltransferase involved in cell wall biosynthesis